MVASICASAVDVLWRNLLWSFVCIILQKTVYFWKVDQNVSQFWIKS